MRRSTVALTRTCHQAFEIQLMSTETNTHTRTHAAHGRINTVLRCEPEPDAAAVSLILVSLVSVASPRGRECAHRAPSRTRFRVNLPWSLPSSSPPCAATHQAGSGFRVSGRTAAASTARQDPVTGCSLALNPLCQQGEGGWREGGREGQTEGGRRRRRRHHVFAEALRFCFFLTTVRRC